ncbi:MAG TPA: DNA polymerase III subunit beta [Pantanalinema sp.]
MEFTCTRDDFSKGIQAVQRAVASRGPLPILSNILIATEGDSLKITATDLEVGIEARVPAHVQTSGAITLAARQLSEIINKLPNSDVAFSVGNDDVRATVQCARSRFVLPSLPADEFPKLPELSPAATMVQLAGDQLAKGIRQTSFAAAKDDKSVISGLYLQLSGGVLEVVATDGYRLAWRKWDVGAHGELKVIVPARAMAELARLLSGADSETVNAAVVQNQILFSVGDRYLTSRLIDGQFPPYGQIIPSSFSYEILIDRHLLQSAVERVSIMASEREAKVVNLNFKAGDLHLQANAADLGEGDEHLPVEFDGEDVKIAFNATYMLDSLKVLEGETVKLSLNGPLAPALVQSTEDPTYSCILMPIRS